TLSDDPDRTTVGVDARKNLLLSASAYGRQRQSHDKCSSNSRYSRHDVSPAAFKRANGLLPPAALGKGRHSVLAPRSVAVGWGAILVVTEIEKRARSQSWLPTSSSSRRPCDVCDNAFNGHRRWRAACPAPGPRQAWATTPARGSAFGVLPSGEVLAKGREHRIISARTPVPYPRMKAGGRWLDAGLMASKFCTRQFQDASHRQARRDLLFVVRGVAQSPKFSLPAPLSN